MNTTLLTARGEHIELFRHQILLTTEGTHQHRHTAVDTAEAVFRPNGQAERQAA